MSLLKHLKYAQKVCVRSAGKLMQQTEMVHPDARVGVAVSGGVDSFTMLQVLMLRQRILPFRMELMALHLNPGFEPDSHAPLAQWVRERGLAAHVELTDHGPRGHSEENQSSSACFYCARLRRRRLFELAAEYNLTHLAFGHTCDDLASTFFMNLFGCGRVDGLSMKEPFFGGELTVIRPLLWLEKKEVIRAARAWELPVWENACPSAGHTRRDEVMEWLQPLLDDKRLKSNVFNAVKRHQLALTQKNYSV